MKVNFDGMRRNATSEMNSLGRVISDIIETGSIYEDKKEGLIRVFNNVAQSVDMFNCLIDENDENFNELDISINRLEEL